MVYVHIHAKTNDYEWEKKLIARDAATFDEWFAELRAEHPECYYYIRSYVADAGDVVILTEDFEI